MTLDRTEWSSLLDDNYIALEGDKIGAEPNLYSSTILALFTWADC